MRPTLTAAALAAAAMLPLIAESKVRRPIRPLTNRWQQLSIAPRGSTRLGISFRPLQAEALGLDPVSTLQRLLEYPFDIVRLGAYWNRIEHNSGEWKTDDLDWQIDAAEEAGKQIILCVGAVKTFGYPEFFVPASHLAQPLPEGTLVTPETHPSLLGAATAHVTQLVEQYRHHGAIIAWQVEHEAVDPLGLEHSWRLSEAFVRSEVDAVRRADPTRQIMMNGFLPTSTPVRLQQWWRTRDQGDSLAVAERVADIVGVDFYPCHAVSGLGSWALYFDGNHLPWQALRRRHLLERVREGGQTLVVTEGQAEPWETVTTPPNPGSGEMFSCPVERVVENYNQCVRWTHRCVPSLDAYLFWGAEYWVMRELSGDPRYIRAFAAVLENSV